MAPPRKFLGLRVKLLLLPVAGTLGLGMVIALLIRTTISEKLTEELRKRASLMAQNVAEDAVDLVLTRATVELHTLVCDHQEAFNLVYAFIVDPDGNVVGNSFGKEFPVGLAEANVAVPGEPYRFQRINTKDGAILDVAVPVLDESIGTARIGVSLKPIDDRISGITNLLVRIVAIATLIVSILAIVLGGLIVKPVRALTEVAKRIAAGDLNVEVEVTSGDEIAQLALALDKMVVDLRTSRDELLSAKEYTENIVRSMQDALIVLSPEGRIRSVNQTILTLLQYEEKDLIGKPFARVIAEEDFHGTKLVELIDKGDVANVDVTYHAKNRRKIPVSLAGSAMRDPEGRLLAIVVTARDMRETKELISALHMQKIAASRERLALLGEVSAGVAHSLRNPLHGVLNCVSILQDNLSKDDQLQETLSLAEEGLYRIDRIAQRLLMLVRATPLQKALSDLNRLVEEEAEMFMRQPAERAAIRIRLALDPALPPVVVDRNRFSEMLLSLLSNALDACQKGDEICISTGIDRARPGYVYLRVQDTGCGIPEAVLSKITDPFFTTKPIGQGTGLGLAIVKRIVQEHQGELKIASSEGQGTTVTLEIPTGAASSLESKSDIAAETSLAPFAPEDPQRIGS